MIAATGPPPDGPWCTAATDTNTAGSPVTDAVTPPTHALIWRCQWTSESSSIALRRPRTLPVGSASHLTKTLTSRSPRSEWCGRSGRARPVDVGVVEHRVASAAHLAGRVGLALDEDVDQPVAEV